MEPETYIVIVRLIGGSVAIVVGLFTLIKGYFEYHLQGVSKRAEQFLSLRSRLRHNDEFSRICHLLETDDEKLVDIAYIEKDSFIGFYEELMLLWNSKILPDHVVDYMFGHFAIRCWESKNFWKGIENNKEYWVYFSEFVRRVKQIRNDGCQPKPIKYRL